MSVIVDRPERNVTATFVMRSNQRISRILFVSCYVFGLFVPLLEAVENLTGKHGV